MIHRFVVGPDGSWLPKEHRNPEGMQGILDARQAPSTPIYTTPTLEHLSRIAGQKVTSVADLDGIILDKPAKAAPKLSAAKKIEMPEKFEERLVIPDSIAKAFRENPNGFVTVETEDGRFTVQERKPEVVSEEEADLDDGDEIPSHDDEEFAGAVTFDQLMDQAMSDAKSRRAERLG